MRNLDPRWYLGVGFILVLVGMLLPFLMVLRVIESTLFLNFFSYGASTLGLFLGLIGAATYARRHRNK